MNRAAIFCFAICTAVAVAGCRGRQHTADASSTANTTPRATAHHTRLPGGSTGSVDTTASPRDVVRRYYDAIQRHDYDAAYALWSDGGKASNQTRPAFAAGFAQTAEVRVNPSDSVVVEGAAGSQYATVPVAIDAVLRDGQHQHFDGTYTLRRSMVDGATPEQLQWRIYSSDLRAR